jgi:hypothetical protein
LVDNELVEVDIGKHLPRALGAMADADIFDRTCSHMAVEGLDRTAELCSRFGRHEQPAQWAWLGLAAATAARFCGWGEGQQVAGNRAYSPVQVVLGRGLLKEEITEPAPILLAAAGSPAELGPGGQEACF